jgi:hypothetical protein
MSDNLQFIQPRHFAVHGFFRRAERAERGGVRGIHPPNGYRVKFQSGSYRRSNVGGGGGVSWCGQRDLNRLVQALSSNPARGSIPQVYLVIGTVTFVYIGVLNAFSWILVFVF